MSLGTDVSGGFSPSILVAVQHASMCSKVVAMQSPTPPDNTSIGSEVVAMQSSSTPLKFANQQLSVATLFYLATQGGADVCDMRDRIGSLVSGKAFDALVVSVRNDAGNPAIWGVDMDPELGVRDGEKSEAVDLDNLLERFLFCGDDRNIRRVYVQGRFIGGKEHTAKMKEN